MLRAGVQIIAGGKNYGEKQKSGPIGPLSSKRRIGRKISQGRRCEMMQS